MRAKAQSNPYPFHAYRTEQRADHLRAAYVARRQPAPVAPAAPRGIWVRTLNLFGVR